MSTMSAILVLSILLTGIQLVLGMKLTYSIDEQRPAGSKLGNLADDANLRDFVSAEEFTRLRYSFLSQVNPHTSNFSIDSVSGDLTTTQELDREALCNFLFVCRLSFEAVAQSNLGSFFQKIQLNVIINDINDNAPEFSVSTYNLEISEGSNTGKNFPLIGAIDRDTGVNNSVRSYDLQPKNSPFVLINHIGASGVITISLELVQPLDREFTDNYQLMVLARDGGSPQKTGTLNLDITIKDINDNAPVFTQPRYTANISETTPPGRVIVSIRATDLDINENGNITYHFRPRQPENVLRLFKLNRTSGQLKTSGSLEYEAGKTHIVIVEAHDHGVPAKTSETVVDVTIIDTHNDAPEMHINVFHRSGVAHVSEYSELGRVVAHIAVKDPDSGSNGEVHCNMSDSSFELRELDKNEFKVILVKILDREHVVSHNVTVICNDGGSPPKMVRGNLLVSVTDENDNAPTFSDSVFYASIIENNPTGASVKTLRASDKDTGVNAEIVYRIKNDPSNMFNVFRNGTVVAAMSFDREQYPEVVVKVLAIDRGTPKLTTTATIIVTILDVNDQHPVFTNSTFRLSVPEESPDYTIVGQVNATDSDLDENSIVMYQLHHSTDADFPFIVYADGVIKTSRPLDREIKTSYSFVVVATDLGRPPLNSTARVVITVMDINDHTPDILFPSAYNNTAVVLHTHGKDSPVTFVRAVDKDKDRNADLSFYIEGGNGSSLFLIDHKTGAIRLKKRLQAGDVDVVYSLMVVAQDQGSPQRATQSELFIEVRLGNATMAQSNQGSINIITAVVLVGITVLLAVVVIAVICLLRSSDKKKRLYHAKAEEEKVMASIHRHGSSVSSSSKNSTTPLSDKDSEKKEKEVSFSLDEENNVSTSSGSVGYNARNNDCLFTIPEDTEQGKGHKGKSKQQKFSTFKDDGDKNHTHIRFHDDSGSDLSGDISISDSGRGGSDVEIQSHGGSSNPLESDMNYNQRHQRLPIDHQSASPVASFSTFYGSDTQANSYDNSSLTDSVHSKQFPDNHPHHNGAIPYRARAQNSSSASPHRLSIPPRMKSNHHQGNWATQHSGYGGSQGQLSHNGVVRQKTAPDSGTYVHLKQTPTLEGEYMDMNGHKMVRRPYDESASEVNTSMWDNDTTTSGSYTVDPNELCDEIDRLFFKESMAKDILV